MRLACLCMRQPCLCFSKRDYNLSVSHGMRQFKYHSTCNIVLYSVLQWLLYELACTARSTALKYITCSSLARNPSDKVLHCALNTDTQSFLYKLHYLTSHITEKKLDVNQEDPFVYGSLVGYALTVHQSVSMHTYRLSLTVARWLSLSHCLTL